MSASGTCASVNEYQFIVDGMWKDTPTCEIQHLNLMLTYYLLTNILCKFTIRENGA